MIKQMTRIRTSNIIKNEVSKELIKTVKCPFCNTYLERVPDYVIVAKCKYCDRAFKIEQDPDKWTFEESTPSHRTMAI